MGVLVNIDNSDVKVASLSVVAGMGGIPNLMWQNDPATAYWRCHLIKIQLVIKLALRLIGLDIGIDKTVELDLRFILAAVAVHYLLPLLLELL